MKRSPLEITKASMRITKASWMRDLFGTPLKIPSLVNNEKA
jgi:hypothetical protein